VRKKKQVLALPVDDLTLHKALSFYCLPQHNVRSTALCPLLVPNLQMPGFLMPITEQPKGSVGNAH
jgi:hypothetical protein